MNRWLCNNCSFLSFTRSHKTQDWSTNVLMFSNDNNRSGGGSRKDEACEWTFSVGLIALCLYSVIWHYLLGDRMGIEPLIPNGSLVTQFEGEPANLGHPKTIIERKMYERLIIVMNLVNCCFIVSLKFITLCYLSLSLSVIYLYST